jgi:hypothetical protein
MKELGNRASSDRHIIELHEKASHQNSQNLQYIPLLQHIQPTAESA